MSGLKGNCYFKCCGLVSVQLDICLGLAGNFYSHAVDALVSGQLDIYLVLRETFILHAVGL